MAEIYRFYNDLLVHLQFSIAGHQNLEEKINQFFNRITSNSFFRSNLSIEFFSYSYARLIDINSWKTDAFSKSFYFHSFNEKYSLLLLSFYYYLRAKRGQPAGISAEDRNKINTADVLADLFIKDCGFRLKCISSGEWDFSYIQSKNTFSVKIPLDKIFRIPESGIPIEQFAKSLIRKFLEKLIISEKKSFYVLHNKQVSNLYSKANINHVKEYENTPDGNSHKELFEGLFLNEDELKRIHDDIKNSIIHFHFANPGFFIEDEVEIKINRWVTMFIPLAFISFAFNCWIEYMPAICGVLGDKQYRNIGSLIVGYKIDQEITLDDRAFFKLISDKISSVIAADIMHKYLDKNLVEQTSICFGMRGIKEITHWTGQYYPQDKALELAKYQVSRAYEFLEGIITSEISNGYLVEYHEKTKEVRNIIAEHSTCNSIIKEAKDLRDKYFQFHYGEIDEFIKRKWALLKKVWDHSEFETHINPLAVIEDQLTMMIESFNSKKSIEAQNIFYTIYAKTSPYIALDMKNAKEVENYIIFGHDHKKNLTKEDVPNWLNHLNQVINFVGEFYYYYPVDDTYNLVDINLDPFLSTEMSEFLKKMIEKCGSSITYYILKFKSFKQ